MTQRPLAACGQNGGDYLGPSIFRRRPTIHSFHAWLQTTSKNSNSGSCECITDTGIWMGSVSLRKRRRWKTCLGRLKENHPNYITTCIIATDRSAPSLVFVVDRPGLVKKPMPSFFSVVARFQNSFPIHKNDIICWTMKNVVYPRYISSPLRGINYHP